VKAVVITNAGDARDQRWLDGRIEAIESGVEAVVEIARNWTEGRELARLHPGVSAAEYVTARVGVLGKAVVPVLLQESNWSNRQIAVVAGVSDETVNRTARATNVARDRGPVIGADGKTYTPRVAKEEAPDEIDLDTGPDEGGREDAYRRVLREYVAGIVRVQPPTIGTPPTLYRRRHELERRLQAVLAEVMS
jgi:hypothetical protein